MRRDRNLPWHASFVMGVGDVTPPNVRQPKKVADVDLDHAWGIAGASFVGRRTIKTHIMSILCNATQSAVQCRMADPDWMRRCRTFSRDCSETALKRFSFLAWRHPLPRG